jgi:hypothetical protein
LGLFWNWEVFHGKISGFLCEKKTVWAKFRKFDCPEKYLLYIYETVSKIIWLMNKEKENRKIWFNRDEMVLVD